jgi:hypothetical protein
MSNINICSLSDINYLSRFLVLYESLINLKIKNKLYLLALDNKILSYLNKKKYKNLIIIKLSDLEKKYHNLKKAKKNRSKIEYYFTLSPFLIKYVKEVFSINNCYYIDADIIFLKNFKTQNKFFLKKSICIIKQNWKEKYGKYNVGLIYFNFRYKETLRIVNKWSDNCIKWCYDRCENGKYADQKYLDDWPNQGKSILILDPVNSVLSPWDLKDASVLIFKKKSFAFHYHDLEIINKNLFSTGIGKYHKIICRKLVKNFYLKNIVLQLLAKENIKLNSKLIRLKNDNQKNISHNIRLNLRLFKKRIIQLIRFDLFKIDK